MSWGIQMSYWSIIFFGLCLFRLCRVGSLLFVFVLLLLVATWLLTQHYYYYYYYFVSCHRPVLHITWTNGCPHRSSFTYLIMCDVPSIAIFCSESVARFPVVTSTFFFKPFVTVLLTPVVPSIIIHFIFHVCCISIRGLYILVCFLLPAAWLCNPLVLPHLSGCFFFLFFFNYSMWPICHNLFIWCYYHHHHHHHH